MRSQLIRGIVGGAVTLAAFGMPSTAKAQDVQVVLKASPAVKVVQNQDFRVEQTAHETRTVQLGTAGVLEVSNISGEIKIAAGSSRDVSVDIVKRAKARTEADAKRGLQEVTVEIDHRGERAIVQTRYPDRRQLPYNVSVSYTITAPAGTRIVANSTAGNISVQGIKGDVSANATAGNIDINNAARVSLAKSISGNVTISGLQSDDSLEASTVAGNVFLLQSRARRLLASAVGGNITVRDVTCDSADLNSMAGEIEYTGPLAKSGRYQLQTHSGLVRFIPTGPIGFALEGRTFAGAIRTEVPLQVQRRGQGRGPQHSIQATYGDGSAVVILTTFSGDVVVTKK